MGALAERGMRKGRTNMTTVKFPARSIAGTRKARRIPRPFPQRMDGPSCFEVGGIRDNPTRVYKRVRTPYYR